MLLQLGDFQFQVSTLAYQELTRASSVRWVVHDIVSNNQRLQATGRNNDTIRLQGVFYPQFASEVGGAVGTESIDHVRDLMNEQQPLLLTAATGDTLGYWVIETLDTGHSLFSPGQGVPRKQTFTIGLKWHGTSV